MIPPITIDKRSPFLGEACALCKEPFAPGDEIVVCPDDATRHHTQCWRANGNKCAAYGCTGHGEVDSPSLNEAVEGEVVTDGHPADDGRSQGNGRSKVRTMPSSSFGCAQGCFLISIGLAVLLFAIACFGLWAMLDYIMIDVLGWSYREPISGVLPAINALILVTSFKLHHNM
ncbi:MAG: hypothetical protein H6662_09065 [Ardenticatenaceae bacterium]|nr:hypothetical protein [Ardenticatenaceae bacterium]MCB8990761.1 hypothetical protein [Ardenticatenaceae bacterium]